MTEIAITFTPDGIGHALYTEAINLGQIGALCVARATLVEFDNNAQYWRVYDRTGFPMFNSPSRQACLDWERQYLESQEDMKHELQRGADSVAVDA
jgi:hypothetical protein